MSPEPLEVTIDSPGQTGAWLLRPRPSPQAWARLFCFPFAGGGGSTFHAWADQLPAMIDVCSVQLPGRENRLAEPLCRSLSELLARLETALLPLLDRPFAIFGHSMGALIGFEFAHRVWGLHGLAPVHLFVSARGAPHLGPQHPPLHRLPDREFLDRIADLDGAGPGGLADPQLRDLLLPVLRADFELCETHRYQDAGRLPCPISALGGLEDRHVGREELEAWRQHTASIFALRLFPGGHFFLRSDRGAVLDLVRRGVLDGIAG